MRQGSDISLQWVKPPDIQTVNYHISVRKLNQFLSVPTLILLKLQYCGQAEYGDFQNDFKTHYRF